MGRADIGPIGKDDLGVFANDIAGEGGGWVSDNPENIVPGNLIECGHEEDTRGSAGPLHLCHPECSGVHTSPQVCRGLEGTADMIMEGKEGMVMTDYHKMPGKGRRRVHVAMEVPHPVDDRPFLCPDFSRPEISFNTGIVVAGEYQQRDPVP